MPKNLDAELDDFIRWLATMPQHLSNYRRDPEAVMVYSRLSEMARVTLRGWGKEAVVMRAKEKLEEILTSPEAQRRTDFTRDRSVAGFGGTILHKEPGPR